MVTFPLSLRVSEISPLLCSSTPLFPTPPLVSPKFQHVSLGIGRWAWAKEPTKSEGVGLIARAISFQDFQPGGLRKMIFSQDCVSAVQGHPRSLILVPIESAYETSY